MSKLSVLSSKWSMAIGIESKPNLRHGKMLERAIYMMLYPRLDLTCCRLGMTVSNSIS